MTGGTLIIPPSGFLLDERVFPSLGVLRIAAVLEQAGVNVAVLDLSGSKDVAAEVKRHCDANRSAWFGITATTPQLPAAIAVARQLRTIRPKSKLILGGPHVTLLNASKRKASARERAAEQLGVLRKHFDVLVAGDGELAMWHAICPGVSGLINADTTTSPFFLKPEQLATMPFAARHKIDLATYHYEIEGHRSTSLIGQLGCPFGCTFCGGRNSPAFRKIRLRPADRAVEELRHLATQYGYTGAMFQDDELNVNPAMMEMLAGIEKLQADLGTEMRFRGFLKSQLVTEDQAAALFRAGFRHVLVGFEAADDRILTNINKKATLEENTHCMAICRAAGLKVKALMSIGHAGETEATVMAVRDWLIEVEPHDFDVTIITVYPGTPYHDEAVENDGHWTYTAPATGDRLHFRSLDFSTEIPFYKGIPGDYNAFVWTDSLSSQDILRLRDCVEREVRDTLGIPWPKAWTETHLEHSMGQN